MLCNMLFGQAEAAAAGTGPRGRDKLYYIIRAKV